MFVDVKQPHYFLLSISICLVDKMSENCGKNYSVFSKAQDGVLKCLLF